MAFTIGASSDTVALACGASQTGFGRTGTVDWVTTIKTNSDSPITAESGKGYFLNTTAAVITINLPTSPSAGDIVSIKDYARTWGTYGVTVGRGGSNMDGNAEDTAMNTSGVSATFIYMDGTKGWTFINDDSTSQAGEVFVAATGGNCICTCGDYKIHKFTGPGTFTVTSAAPTSKVDYVVVAGGGGGGSGTPACYSSGGGGAGGYRESHCATISGPYTASPLATPTSMPVTGSPTPYAITVGGAGAASPGPDTPGGKGSNSIFSSITSAGGGAGITNPGTTIPACAPGGSGGGSGTRCSSCTSGVGNDPPTNPSQGFPGGANPVSCNSGSGGGGATAAGVIAISQNGADGGAGTTTEISTVSTSYAGGGGGGGAATGGCGGVGGGGAGSSGPPGLTVAGTTNLGGGGGAGSNWCLGADYRGAAGGSGVVIIRYKFQ